MIGPNDIVDGDPHEVALAEARIDASIRRAAERRSWPARVNVGEWSEATTEGVLERARKAGWRARLVRDFRDGDFIEITRP